MVNTKQDQLLSCRCGGHLRRGKVPYKRLELDGLVCDGCSEKAFSWGQFADALKAKESHNRKNEAIPWHSGRRIVCRCGQPMVPCKVTYAAHVFDGYKCTTCKNEIFNISEFEEETQSKQVETRQENSLLTH